MFSVLRVSQPCKALRFSYVLHTVSPINALHTLRLPIHRYALTHHLPRHIIASHQPARALFTALKRRLFKEDEKKQRKSDRVDRLDVLVYRNPNHRELKWIYAIAYLAMIICTANVLDKTVEFVMSGRDLDSLDQDDPVTMAVFGFFAIGLIWAICGFMLKRCFMRIYFEPTHGKFTGIRMNLTFGPRSLRFTARDIKEKAPNAIIGYVPGNFYIKGWPIFVMPKHFSSPRYYKEFRSSVVSPPIDERFEEERNEDKSS
jgi:hypothetical protein